MTTGKKSHTANHPVGITGNQITSRAVAGSGIRGRHATLKVAAVGSTTTKDAPSVHNVSVLCPSLFQRSLPVSNLCALLVAKNSGATFPMATLSHFYWRQQTRSAGSGETLSLPSCSRHRASPKLKLRHPSMSWLRRNLSTTKPPRTRDFLRKSSRNRRRPSRSCGSNSKPNKISLEDLCLRYHRPRKLRSNPWMVYVLCVLLCMVLAPMATNMHSERPAPMEQDTDRFKQKIRLLNESAKRARTESNTDHSAILECVDGLSGEANALFLKNANASDIFNFPLKRKRVVSGK